MTEYEDLVPEPAADYVDTIQNGPAPSANVAAINALEAVAGTDPDPLELEMLISLIAEETNLTKTHTREKYGQLAAENNADTWSVSNMTVVASEDEEEDDKIEVLGEVEGVPFRLYGTFGDVKRGNAPVTDTLERVRVEHGLDVTVPEGGEWRELYEEWVRRCRSRGSITTTTEPPNRPAHSAAETLTTRLSHFTPYSEHRAWQSGERAFYVPMNADEPGDISFLPFSLLEAEANNHADVSPRQVENILYERGLLARHSAEGKKFDQLPDDFHRRVLPFDTERLIEEGHLNPDKITEEPDE